MAIIPLKAWYLEYYEPLSDVLKRPHDLRLSKNSLLKSGLRADFLDDSQEVETSAWFQRYLVGETVEFYIEGSGGYSIANIDLISQEIYFSKQELISALEPIIFFSHQAEDSVAREAMLEVLNKAIDALNIHSRLPLSLEMAIRGRDNPTRVSDSQLRKIRKSLLFVADVSPLTSIRQEQTQILLPNPNVCLEIGYALQTKRSKQILLVKRDRPDLEGNFPFDIAPHQQLNFSSVAELDKTLLSTLKTLLQQFNLSTLHA
ncbi:hypothetical protein [Gloeocapsa sp. PCC 73106]|uniref:hypothetical protein n=1 Tax=Gloeocapsa sp. PCC 73106 TaxID=102232 RepID=UPI0002ABA3C4|nr:hypothetical protein [Gloeocapsa sp. PCC 73106]ELR98989.1 hypothetical protein GLO73106DRAFT_00028320 [Gloeocapsa sp. PCC 73106]